MFKSIMPKGAPFFEYLQKQNEILCAACALVPRLMEDGRAEEAAMHQKVTLLEDQGDAMYLTLVKSLSQTFITPIDREDILRIGKEQESTLDLLQNLVARLYVFNVEQWPASMVKIAHNLNAMCLLTKSMLEGLAHRKDSHDTRAFRALRSECEMLLSSGLGEELDVSELTPEVLLQTLKLTRAYDRMEQAVLQVVELAEAIEEAVLKNV